MASLFLMLVSIALVVQGVVMILAPKKYLKVALSIFKLPEPRLTGLLPLFMGILLLLSAGASAVAWLVVLMGLAGIAKAVYVFLNPVAKIRANRFLNLPENNYRALGILVLILGVILFVTRL